jgi:hypothetical protein
VKSIGDVSKTYLDQVEEFFVSYNKQRGKKFKVTGTGGPKKALAIARPGAGSPIPCSFIQSPMSSHGTFPVRITRKNI